MNTVTEPCELHELTGCSICSGLDKRLAAEGVTESPVGWPPPGYVWAQWPGKCASCHEPFDVNDPIRFSKTANGWVGAECCG